MAPQRTIPLQSLPGSDEPTLRLPVIIQTVKLTLKSIKFKPRCKLLIDGIETLQFEGTVLPEHFPKSLLGTHSRDDTKVEIQLFKNSKLKGRAEVLLWTLLAAEQSATLTLLKPQEPSSKGKVTGTAEVHIQRYEQHIRAFYDPKLNPETESLSTFARLAELLNVLPILDINPSAQKLTRFHLSMLYWYLEKDIKRQIAELGYAVDPEGKQIRPDHLRGNALDETLTQCHMLVECFSHYSGRATFKHDRHAEAKLKAIGSEIMDRIASTSAILCEYANIYLTATYPTLHSSLSSRPDCNMLIRTQQALVHLRARMVHLDCGRAESPPEPLQEFIETMLSLALPEVREGRGLLDWKMASYTAVLCSFRWLHAQDIYKVIIQRLRRTAASDIVGRDELRRLLTHIIQEVDLLPSILILKDRVMPDKAPTAGVGSYALVYAGRMKVDGETDMRRVAIKSIQFLTSGTLRERALIQMRMYSEVVSCWTLSHPNVLPLLGMTVDIGGTSLILPFKKIGNMSALVAELRAGSSAVTYQGPLVTLSHRWIGEIIKGLLYLHTEGIIHGDLRGSNVLLEDDLTAVIADFGLSHFANGHSRNYASRRSGNVEWLSPELLSENGPNGDPRPTKESDIYSFAMVCIETYTGEPPFAHVAPTDLAFRDRVIQGTRPSRPMEPSRGGLSNTERMNDKLWALLEDCWHGDKTWRPDAVGVEERLRELQYIS